MLWYNRSDRGYTAEAARMCRDRCLVPAIRKGRLPRSIVRGAVLQEPDPLLDVPQLPTWGWFAGAEEKEPFLAGGRHVKNELQNNVPFAGRMDNTIALQSAPGSIEPDGFASIGLVIDCPRGSASSR